jgi:hypothetical protein
MSKKSDLCNHRGRQSAGADTIVAMVDAKALALKLIDACRRHDASPFVAIQALSIALGATIASVAKSNEVIDVALDTMYRAIACRDDDHAGGLQ